MSNITLRAYTDADEGLVVELWRRTWQRAYPKIDFAVRVPWWRARLRAMQKNRIAIVLAERAGAIIGFVTVDPESHYLDQMLVAPEAQGSSAAQQLMAEAKCISPTGLILRVNQDNERAIRFYERSGFVCVAEEQNSNSGNLVYSMIFVGN